METDHWIFPPVGAIPLSRDESLSCDLRDPVGVIRDQTRSDQHENCQWPHQTESRNLWIISGKSLEIRKIGRVIFNDIGNMFIMNMRKVAFFWARDMVDKAVPVLTSWRKISDSKGGPQSPSLPGPGGEKVAEIFQA